MALKTNVIINGKIFDPSDKGDEYLKEEPDVKIIRKGLLHIFKPIEKELPDHDITVSWNEDEKNIGYSSETLDQSVVGDALKRHHGIDFL